jgi:hypothetical protein
MPSRDHQTRRVDISSNADQRFSMGPIRYPWGSSGLLMTPTDFSRRPVRSTPIRLCTFLSVASLALFLAGCGPFVEVVKLDETTRVKARSDVKQYIEAPPTYKVIQNLEATSCRQKAWDPPATNQDAIDQLRFKVSRAGANGIANVFCDSEGVFDLGKNCWSSVKCRGTAIEVPP